MFTITSQKSNPTQGCPSNLVQVKIQKPKLKTSNVSKSKSMFLKSSFKFATKSAKIIHSSPKVTLIFQNGIQNHPKG